MLKFFPILKRATARKTTVLLVPDKTIKGCQITERIELENEKKMDGEVKKIAKLESPENKNYYRSVLF